MLEDEEERLWQEQRETAYKLADKAREKFRQQFEVCALKYISIVDRAITLEQLVTITTIDCQVK